MTYAVVSLTGHVGSDPELRKAGTADVIQFSLAVNRKRGREEFTDWYRCLSFQDGLIDVIEKYIKKGQRVSVSGELAQQKWEDRDRVEKTTMEVLIYKLDLGDPPSGGGRGDDRGGRDARGGDRGRDDRGSRDRGRDDRGGRDAPRGGGREDDRRGRDDRGGRDAPRGGRDDDRRGGGREDDRRDDRRSAAAADDRRPAGGTRVEDDEIPF